MKKVLFTCVLLGCAFVAVAQYGGDFLLGGRLNYVGGGRVITDIGRKDLGYTVKVTVSPGYFITSDWQVGLNVGYEYMTDPQGHQYTVESLPFLRYYLGRKALRFFVQLESGPGWGQSLLKDHNDGRHFVWTTALKPGLFVRIKEHSTAEVTLTSLEYRNIRVDSGNRRLGFNQFRFSGLAISFGMGWMF